MNKYLLAAVTLVGLSLLAMQPANVAWAKMRAVTERDHIRGASDAKITVVVYADLECPFCAQFHTTMKKILAAYPTQVRWVYRNWPLTTIDSQSLAKANATECANEQGKFWDLTNLIYTYADTHAGNTLDVGKLPALAKIAGVADMTKFKKCVKDEKYNQKVLNDAADAQAAGGFGTPYSIVIGPNGSRQIIEGAQPFEQVKQVIDSLLKSKNS